jgi:hypothetical protein
MAFYEIPTDLLVLNILLYGCLPLWVIMGFADYLCHRAARIERTTGVRESVFHFIMGAQMAFPVFLGLLFEVNVLILLLSFTLLILHVWAAHQDVVLAQDRRRITIWEVHAHSFLEVLPFVVLLLIITKRWPAFVDLITFNWAGNLSLVPKQLPIDTGYIVGYFLFMVTVGVAPYIEEMYRCWRARNLPPANVPTPSVMS